MAQEKGYKVDGCIGSLRSISVDLQPLLLPTVEVDQDIQDATHVVLEVEDGVFSCYACPSFIHLPLTLVVSFSLFCRVKRTKVYTRTSRAGPRMPVENIFGCTVC